MAVGFNYFLDTGLDFFVGNNSCSFGSNYSFLNWACFTSAFFRNFSIPSWSEIFSTLSIFRNSITMLLAQYAKTSPIEKTIIAPKTTGIIPNKEVQTCVQEVIKADCHADIPLVKILTPI